MADSSARGKQRTAADFKANCGTEKGRKNIRIFLDQLLKLQDHFSSQKKEWCSFLIAGGQIPEEYKTILQSYDTPTICGLVWNKNFVAYRCRDCGILPCMSICADCFHAGNHEGHDFNMFKSQAGGACDCGDENVMKREGFCTKHGNTEDGPRREVPPELLAMARIVIPYLCRRLYLQLDNYDKKNQCPRELDDANCLVDYFMQLCEIETVRNLVSEILLMRMSDVESAQDKGQKITLPSLLFGKQTLSQQISSESSSHSLISSSSSAELLDEDSPHRTFLEFFMSFVTKYEFPQKIVTFLLHLLPKVEYKEAFTRVFCQHYQKIAKALVTTTDPRTVEQLSNRVIHVSVQLFSNKALAEKMAQEQNLLHVMVKVLKDMISRSLRGDRGGGNLVANCDSQSLSCHCYWPVVSDFINVLSHQKVVESFMLDKELISQWFSFVLFLSGMNYNTRQMLHHLEFEPNTYYTAFSVELEASSSPMWSFVNGCVALKSTECLMNMIRGSIAALEKWYKNVESQPPRRGEVTFHLPIHRHYAAFLSQDLFYILARKIVKHQDESALSSFDIPLESMLPSQDLLAKIAVHLLQIQCAVCEVRDGRWVRNGYQIRSQVRLYMECHFCNSMVDLDIFLLQVCSMCLDPDFFINTMIEWFGLSHWLQFGPLTAPTPPGSDADTEVNMVEGLLNLLLTLLTTRLHLGMTDKDILQLEMASQLAISDKTHSQLVDLIPDKPEQSPNIQSFEETLAQLADYKAPGFESGSMQQGMYTPRDAIWEANLDPVHISLRAIQRQDVQSAMSRYTAYAKRNSSNTTASSLWPPSVPMKPLPKQYQQLVRLLHCKTLHRLLFFIFHKASQDSASIPESVLALAVNLTSLSLEAPVIKEDKVFQPLPVSPEEKDSGCQIVSRCVDFLETHGRNVKGLHQTEDLTCVNQELLTRLRQDPHASLDPSKDSAHDVCVVMAYALHMLIEPPLFKSFLPFMGDVLTSALNNQSSTQERVAQLQHIQYLIDVLPPHRREVLKKLTAHLVNVSERLNIPPKNLSLVNDESQLLELSMLLMYLVKYNDWLFRLRKPPKGWPKNLSDMEFPSSLLVENIRHLVTSVTVPEPMDTSAAPDADMQGDCNASTSFNDPSVAHGSVRRLATLSNLREDDTDEADPLLVEQFVSITSSPERVAKTLLRACDGDLELAINTHLNMEENISELDQSQSVQETSKKQSEEIGGLFTARQKEEATHSSAVEMEEVVAGIDESILSLLVKLITSPQGSLTVTAASGIVGGDGPFYINKLLQSISRSSPENSAAVAKLVPCSSSSENPEDTKDHVMKNALRRQRARERQQKLLAEFASKQKVFMEKQLSNPGNLEHMEVDAGSVPETEIETFDCVICGQSSASTEEAPVGLVVLLQPSAVLRYREEKPRQMKLPLVPEDEDVFVPNCRTAYGKRFNAFKKHFSRIVCLNASAVGVDGGVHVQTCGHCLHVSCHQSYLRSLQRNMKWRGEFLKPCLEACWKTREDEEVSILHQIPSFNPRLGEFTCPLCRQLGNGVLPILPSNILLSKRTLSKGLEKSHEDCLKDLHANLRKYRQNCMTKLTASALNLNILGAAVKAVVETVVMLDGEQQRVTPEQKFSLLCGTVRTNLELQQVELLSKMQSSQKRSCFAALAQGFQFHSQTLVGPQLSAWCELTGSEGLRETSESLTEAPLLLRDAPSLLLQLMLSWPSPLGLREFRCLVQLLFNVAFTQSLVETCCKFVGDERLSWQETGKKILTMKDQNNLSTEMLLGYVMHLLVHSNLFRDDDQLMGISLSVWSPHTVEQSIQQHCLPFLQLATLASSLYYNTDLPDTQVSDQEFQVLGATLGLCPAPDDSPGATTFSCAQCLRWPHNKPISIVKEWCEALCSVTMRSDTTSAKELLPTLRQWPAPRLLSLPERYDSLIQHYRKQVCKRCNTNPDEPAICLVCGKFLCLQGQCCCNEDRKYECIQHSAECGSGTGIFLIILSSLVIIVRAERVCIWGSVYLDSFGEEDRELRRGKPLFLSKDRFERLQEQWVTHRFDHSCKRWKRHLNNL